MPERPLSPNRPAIVGLSSLAGLVFGIGLVALFEYRDSTLRTDADVELALSLPVLAVVPVMSTARERTRHGRMRIALAVMRAGVLVAIMAVVAIVMIRGL